MTRRTCNNIFHGKKVVFIYKREELKKSSKKY